MLPIFARANVANRGNQQIERRKRKGAIEYGLPGREERLDIFEAVVRPAIDVAAEAKQERKDRRTIVIACATLGIAHEASFTTRAGSNCSSGGNSPKASTSVRRPLRKRKSLKTGRSAAPQTTAEFAFGTVPRYASTSSRSAI